MYEALSSVYFFRSNLQRQKQQRHMKNGDGGDTVDDDAKPSSYGKKFN